MATVTIALHLSRIAYLPISREHGFLPKEPQRLRLVMRETHIMPFDCKLVNAEKFSIPGGLDQGTC